MGRLGQTTAELPPHFLSVSYSENPVPLPDASTAKALPSHVIEMVETLKAHHGLIFPWTCCCTTYNDSSVAQCCICSSENPSYDSEAAAAVIAASRGGSGEILGSGQGATCTTKETSSDVGLLTTSLARVRLGSNKKKLIIVLHLIDEAGITVPDRAVQQARIAFDARADGVFIIIGEAGISIDEVIDSYTRVREVFPDKFIGVNFLADASISGNRIPLDADALWTDFGVDRAGPNPRLQQLASILKQRNWQGLLFGGFFFKGYDQRLPEDAARCEAFANIAKREGIHVLTTSGPGTAQPIEVEQLSKIHLASKGAPIGLASGVDMDNLDGFLPYVDFFIVGSGVECEAADEQTRTFYREAGLPRAIQVGCLDKARIAELAEKIHAAV
jgi:hypothetical protein